MPSKGKSNSNNQPGVRTRRPNVGAKRSTNNRRGQGIGPSVPRSMGPASVAKGDYTQMLNDPCNATLVPGFYGTSEGYMARFHKVISPVDVASGTCGAILWVPDFHCVGPVNASQTRYNCITLAGTSSGASVVIDGYGAGSLAVADPAYNFISGTTAADARTLSACLRMSYLGQMATTQGMVGHIDVAFSAIEDRIAGDALTIDSLFELSQVVQRTNLDPVEQKWTPSAASDKFRGRGDTSGASPDFLVNNTAGAFSIGVSAAADNPRMIGFVWKGYASATPFSSILQFDLYKNIEWRPQATAGISMPVPQRTSIIPPYSTALMALDATVPGWRAKTRAVAQSGAQAVAKKALAYSGQLLLKQAPKLAGFLL